MTDSPVSRIVFRNRVIYIKRDDLLHPDFDGNKARKLAYLFYSDLSSYSRVVSYGSNQSNAMYSMSVFCKLKKLEFIYFTKPFSSYLQNNISGNLAGALVNGMTLRNVDNPKQNALKYQNQEKTIYIPEGVSSKGASVGLSILARELNEFIHTQGLHNPKVFLPSGTGASSLYLQKHMPMYDVYTTPCVGDAVYLRKQFSELEDDESLYPTILELDKKYHFGKLYPEFWDIYNELLDTTGIEFELLYDPSGWMAVIQYLLECENDIIYIHSGGLRGNETMKLRYKYFLQKSDKISHKNT